MLAGAMVALPSQVLAAAIEQPRLTPAEVQDVVSFALPTAVDIADHACTKVLPVNSGFTQSAITLRLHHQPASDCRLAQGQGHDAKTVGAHERWRHGKTMFTAMVTADDPAMLRDFVTSMLGDKAKVGDETCATLDCMMTMIKPFPAKNTADVLELLIEQIVNRPRAGQAMSAKICPAGSPLGRR